MKRLFILLISLIIIYIGLKFTLHFFDKGDHFSYEFDKDGTIIYVTEKSHFKLSDNEDNYQFEVKAQNHTFNFQIFHDFNKQVNIISDIAYYQSDNYECILPFFKDEVLMDIMCYKDENLTYYYNLKGEDENLDKFVGNLKEYKIFNFIDNALVKEVEGINVYKDNLLKDHYIELTSYNGLYNISSNFNSLVYRISLYNKDIYNQKIGIFHNQYYLSADYNQNYEFTKFNLVDFVNLKVDTIDSNYAISTDSYMQGVVDGKVYLYDKDKAKQYEISIDKKTITQLNGPIKYYNNGVWETMTVEQAKQEVKFQYTNKVQAHNIERQDIIGHDFGYTYIYKKNSDKYDVYRSNIGNSDEIYLFSTDNIDNIYYIDNYVYFVDKNVIKVYHDSFGVKKLINYQELEFNKNIKFHIYIKK